MLLLCVRSLACCFLADKLISYHLSFFQLLAYDESKTVTDAKNLSSTPQEGEGEGDAKLTKKE